MALRALLPLSWLLGGSLCLALGGCLSSGPEPLGEPLSPASAAEIVSSLRARSAGLKALTAVVAMSYTSPERDGTFDAVVLYEAPRRLRLQAFKDLVVDSRDLFDIVLTPEGYHLRHGLDAEPLSAAGALETFPAAHPRFSGIYWAGEALFLPGAAQAAAPVDVLGRLPSGVRVETRLASGVRAQWDLDPVSLRPLRGIVFAPNRRIQLEYRRYRGRGGALDFPEEVRFRDGATTIEVQLRELDLAPELGPEVWRP